MRYTRTMDQWTHAIYDATGIPLNEEDLSLALREGQWWLMFHRHPILELGAQPDPPETLDSALRPSLSLGMEKRLSEEVPKIQRLLHIMGAPPHPAIRVTVVNVEGRYAPMTAHAAPERGWPHFVLRLSAKGFDVEVDLNPYTPDTPYDIDDLRRQANVMFHVVQRP